MQSSNLLISLPILYICRELYAHDSPCYGVDPGCCEIWHESLGCFSNIASIAAIHLEAICASTIMYTLTNEQCSLIDGCWGTKSALALMSTAPMLLLGCFPVPVGRIYESKDEKVPRHRSPMSASCLLLAHGQLS